MSDAFYSGIFLSKGYRKGVINDIFRRDFYRVDLAELETNHILRKNLEELEILDCSNLNIPGRRKLEIIKPEETPILKAIVLEWSENLNLLKEAVSTNPIKILTIQVTENTSPVEIIRELDGYWVSHVEIFIDANTGLDLELWRSQSLYFNRIVLFNAEENYQEEPNLYYVSSSVLNEGEPNIFNDTYFICNHELYREAKFYNPSFASKVFIKQNSFKVSGEIKWRHAKTFKEWNEEIRSKVPKIWTSSKDNTDICQNCEFRHVCIDNRLPTQRQSDGLWHHTVECNYNPYIAKWKGEEGYRTLAACGVKSNASGFSIDHERIAKINEELWGSPL